MPRTRDAGRRFRPRRNGLGATLTLPLVTASVANVAVQLNRASGVGASVIDWRTAVGHTISVTDSTGGTHTVDLFGDTFAVKGDITTLDIAGLISGHASFELTQSSISLDLNGDGTGDVIGASLLTFGISHAFLTVGDPTGIHLGVSDASIAIAAISSADGTQKWLAVAGSLAGATFTGVPGFSLTLASVAVKVNQATGATALDWTTALNLDRNASFKDVLTVAGITIDMKTASIAASGIGTVDIGPGLVTGSVAFSLERQTVNLVTPAVTGATLTTVGLRILSPGS